MRTFVYLVKALPDITDVEVNDVGVIENENPAVKTCTVKFLRSGITLELDANKVETFDIHTTGDRHDYKICDRCFKRLETATWFTDNRRKKDNIITKRPSCKNCRKIKEGKSIPLIDKVKWAGTKPEDFSDFTCPICLKTTIVGITKVVLDHDHQTGRVRGWLCESCNTGIGRFDDNPEMVKRAVNWLERD